MRKGIEPVELWRSVCAFGVKRERKKNASISGTKNMTNAILPLLESSQSKHHGEKGGSGCNNVRDRTAVNFLCLYLLAINALQSRKTYLFIMVLILYATFEIHLNDADLLK